MLDIPGLPSTQVRVDVRVTTVVELQALLAILPATMPLASYGMSSGYDHERGCNVHASIEDGALYIRHEG